jgi:hypothetical protein
MVKQTVLILVFMIVLTACSPSAEEQVLPTLIVTDALVEGDVEVTAEVIDVTPTEIRRATLPPTWTPTPDPDAPEEAAAGNPQIGGEGLAIIETGATEPAPMLQAPPTPLEVCFNFGEDREQNPRYYVPGQAATVVWTPVQGAQYYSIMLVNEAGESLLVEYVDGTQYTFGPELLTDRGLYGWEAYPVDSIGQQMCLSRGAQLFPDPNALP